MEKLNILLLGNGGREHALAQKISQSHRLNKLFIAPGNSGTPAYGENVNIQVSDFKSMEGLIRENKISMIVVGPEAPLVEGVVDYFHKPEWEHVRVVGPDAFSAQLEGSKAFAKKFMQKYHIPTAAYFEVSSTNLEKGIDFLRQQKPPYVLKADGLAAGKGVLIIDNLSEAESELQSMLGGKFGNASTTVVIEEFLSGIEFSMFAITDGSKYRILPQAKDYKRIGEGDTGLNTGGMGAISPLPFLSHDFLERVENEIIKPTIHGLEAEKMNYKGFVFFGLIKVGNQAYVIEYNCRMGDPETEAVLPRLDEDIVAMFEDLFSGQLENGYCIEKTNHAATLVLVSGGYPGDFTKGHIINIPADLPANVEVYHAGAVNKEGNIVTSGGRVIAVTGCGESREEALQLATDVAGRIQFEGKYYRRDIGFDL